MKKKKKPPGNQKLGSTTKTSCFLSLAESFHVTGLLLSFVKADDRFFFFGATVQVVIALKIRARVLLFAVYRDQPFYLATLPENLYSQ